MITSIKKNIKLVNKLYKYINVSFNGYFKHVPHAFAGVFATVCDSLGLSLFQAIFPILSSARQVQWFRKVIA